MQIAPNAFNGVSRLLLLLIVGFVATETRPAAAQQAGADGQPLVITVPLQNEPITPVTARYLHRAIAAYVSEN